MKAKARARGFTLVEMMLALALVGLVLVGLNTFVFSMTELWGRNVEPRRFDQHVRALTRYLEAEFRTAALPPSVAAGTPAITPREVRTQAGITEDLLGFELPAGSRLLAWPERPLPDVVCASPELPRSGRSRKLDRAALARQLQAFLAEPGGST